MAECVHWPHRSENSAIAVNYTSGCDMNLIAAPSFWSSARLVPLLPARGSSGARVAAPMLGRRLGGRPSVGVVGRRRSVQPGRVGDASALASVSTLSRPPSAGYGAMTAVLRRRQTGAERNPLQVSPPAREWDRAGAAGCFAADVSLVRRAAV